MSDIACPTRDRLQALLAGQLPQAEQDEITRHVEICAACQQALESLSPASRSWQDLAAHLEKQVHAEPALQQVIDQAKGVTSSQKTEAERTTPNRQVPAGEETKAEAQAPAGDDDLAFLGPPSKAGAIGRLGHYEVLEVIGKGGFGTVLKAFDEKLHRVVAIKVLSPALSASGTARQRFSREARAAAAVTHDHVVTIHVVEEDHRPPYLVMQLIDGMTLQQKLDKVGTLGLKEILRIGMQMAEGLAAAHKQGLVHRDIKPANVLLENGIERVKITDFGLAKIADDASVTQSGVVAGTPMYMSPEQANGETIDHRSDLFSLGTVLYAMCTGRPPFRASGTMAVLKRVIDDTPRPVREINPEIPDWLEAMIAKLHAKRPAERYQTAREVADALGERLAALQSQGRGVAGAEALRSPGEPAKDAVAAAGASKIQPRPRRRWWKVAAVIALLALISWRFGPHLVLTARNQAEIRVELDDPQAQLVLARNGKPIVTHNGSGRFEVTPGTYEVEIRPRPGSAVNRLSFFQQTLLTGHYVPFHSPDLKEIYVGRGDYLKLAVSFKTHDSEAAKTGDRQPPPPAVAPFDEKKAKEHQNAWAKHLGVDVEITNAIGMKLRLIPPGEFLMGTPKEKPTGRGDELPHTVALTRPFAMGIHAVTVAQFQAFVKETGYRTEAETSAEGAFVLQGDDWKMDAKADWRNPGFQQTDQHPVVCVSWNDAKAFCDWLSKKDGRKHALPTEAQWEYAARAGTQARFAFGDDPTLLAEHAWYDVNSDKHTHPVGQKKPNAWGLQDMHGNVWQWTADWYDHDYYAKGGREDPPGPAEGGNRALRGGDWFLDVARSHVAHRGWREPHLRNSNGGFRVALVGDLKAKTPPASKDSFVILAKDAKAERKFATLAEAVVAAQSGDTIEIRGNGPFVSEPVNFNETLVIRAASGYRPVLRMRADKEDAYYFLATNQPLVLEGLVLERLGSEKDLVGHKNPVLLGVLNVGEPMSLRMCNCQLSVRHFGHLFAGQIARQFQFVNCLFLDGDLAWTPSDEGEMTLDNCVSLEGRIWVGTENSRARADLRLRRSTLLFREGVTWAVLRQPVFDDPKAMKWGFDASGSIFDCRQRFHRMHWQYLKELPSLEECQRLARRLFRWKEEANLLNEAPCFLDFFHFDHKPLIAAKAFEDYQRFWGLPAKNSATGQAVFQGGNLRARLALDPANITAADFRLAADSPGKGAGPGGKDLGADVDLVGPGPAYEKWKKSPEYQEWLKKTGQDVAVAPKLEPWVQLFNGKDLTNWKTHPNLGSDWKIDDGVLVGRVVGYLFSDKGDYENFHYRIEAKINQHGMAAQCFRSSFEPRPVPAGNPYPSYPPEAYRACIDSSSKDQKTGTLHRYNTIGQQFFLSREKELLVPADTWFTQEVIAVGTRVIVKVNGKIVADIDETKQADKGAGARAKGHLGLCVFGPDAKSVLHVRKIEVKELPPIPPARD